MNERDIKFLDRYVMTNWKNHLTVTSPRILHLRLDQVAMII